MSMLINFMLVYIALVFDNLYNYTVPIIRVTTFGKNEYNLAQNGLKTCIFIFEKYAVAFKM